MRRRAVQTIVLLSLAALLLGCGRRGPVLSGGKPVHYWVDALQDADARLRKQAALKLGNAGPADAAVVPALRQALHDRDAAVRREAILALVRSARPGADAGETGELIAWGPSPRASQALMLAVRARALLEGRYAPSVDDVVALAEPVLKHRMALTFAARADGETIPGVVGRLKARI